LHFWKPPEEIPHFHQQVLQNNTSMLGLFSRGMSKSALTFLGSKQQFVSHPPSQYLQTFGEQHLTSGAEFLQRLSMSSVGRPLSYAGDGRPRIPRTFSGTEASCLKVACNCIFKVLTLQQRAARSKTSVGSGISAALILELCLAKFYIAQTKTVRNYCECDFTV